MPDISNDSNRQQLDNAPPRPPRQGKSLMQMATDRDDNNRGLGMPNPAVRLMEILGNIRKEFMEMSVLAPNMANGLQQILTGLQQVIPQSAADIVAGQPPGSGGSGMGAPQANAAPTAPPVQAGMQ